MKRGYMNGRPVLVPDSWVDDRTLLDNPELVTPFTEQLIVDFAVARLAEGHRDQFILGILQKAGKSKVKAAIIRLRTESDRAIPLDVPVGDVVPEINGGIQ